MLPLTRPEWDYITAGPWVVTFEWSHGKIESSNYDDIAHALYQFFDGRYPVVHPSSPERRVLFDVRGKCILGLIERIPTDPPAVATSEVLDVMESIGMDLGSVTALRLEIMWDNSEAGS